MKALCIAHAGGPQAKQGGVLPGAHNKKAAFP